jgi:phospholipase C
LVATGKSASLNHIVVLMLENRSFDHMLGLLYADAGNISPKTGQPFEGLGGHESNLDGNGHAASITKIAGTEPAAYFSPGADPGEGYVATNEQLWGSSSPPPGVAPTMSGFVTNFAATLSTKDLHRKNVPGTTANDIMKVFSPEALPVLSGLARGFAVCDNWYASVPTETFPNRAFVAAATSQGHMDDAVGKFTVPSIYGALGRASVSWSIYGYAASPLTRMDFPDTMAADDSHFGHFSDFQASAKSGNLPSYSFLEPSWGSSGNSQHPNYDVALGEQLILDVYRAIRSSPAWPETLLVIVYDEHGGCYDHVPPPFGATPPDATPGEFGFDFTRFGVRVPAVLVSPFIPEGTVHRPSGSTPFDHTSILKTIEEQWGLPALTARDAAAPTLSGALSLSQPRSDDPLSGVTAPPPSQGNPAAGQASHIQQLHAELASYLPIPGEGRRSTSPITAASSEAEAEQYIRERTSKWVSTRARDSHP